MTLLTSIFAAIICTVLWYRNDAENDMLLHIPVFMFWGASLMWLADAIFEYAKLGAELSVIALGLVIWLVILLVKDPKGRIKTALFKNRE